MLTDLERESQCKLNGAWKIGLLTDPTKAGRRQIAIRNSKLGVVEEVEDFCAELQFDFLCNVEEFVDREIEVLSRLRSHYRVNAVFVSESEHVWLREAGCVEPFSSPVGAVWITGKVPSATWGVIRPNGASSELAESIPGCLKGDRDAAAKDGDAVDPPATNKSIRETVHLREVRLAASEGEIEPVIDNQILGKILKAKRVLGTQIAIVLNDSIAALSVLEGTRVVGIAQQLRPRICDLQKPIVADMEAVHSLKSVVRRIAISGHHLAHALILRVGG